MPGASTSGLWAAGTFYRWAELTPELQRFGVKRSIQIACMVLGTAIGVANASHALGSVRVNVAVAGNVEQIVTAQLQIFLGFLRASSSAA